VKIYRYAGLEISGKIPRNVMLSIAHGYNLATYSEDAMEKMESIMVVDEHSKEPKPLTEYFSDTLIWDVVFDEIDENVLYVITLDDDGHIELWTFKAETESEN
jgi:hypothetical protein